jgi:polar amino acid transport system substrate-binding protein
MTRRLMVLLAILSFCLVARGNETSQANQSDYVKDHNRLTPFLTPQEIVYLDNSGVFTVCNVVQARRSDASLDLLKLLTRHAGIKLVASPLLSWQEALAGLKNKSCDILPWATETQARTATMNFTRPYARIIRVLVSKREQPYITDISLFDDQVFAMEKANNIAVLLKQYYPKIRTVSSNSTAQGFALVVDNKAFASIASLYSVGGLFGNGSLEELKIAGRLPSDFDDVVSLATRKDDQILHNILQRAVLTTDPKLISEFMNKGAIYVFDPEVNYSRIWLVGGIAFFLFLVLFWWNRNLRQLNYKLERAHTELKVKSQLLEVLSITDPLTDTYNRIKMDRVFEQEIKRSTRYKQPLSVIMIDIDYFKNVNDNHGHLVGDRVLQKFADTIKNHIRVNDVLGRWGGEEFLVICPTTGIKEAKSTAYKLRQIIESTEFAPVRKMTASFGVAEWHQNESEEVLLANADHAMYLAKHQGRNQVCTSSKI